MEVNMSSNLYNLFINAIYETVETLVYKHALIAQTINKSVIEKGYSVDYNNPLSWKYYQNMAGIYHVSDSDEISQINSNGSPYMQIKIASDTGSIDVDFTTGLIDPITGSISIANEYQYGSYLYNELLTRYPNHEELILGILNPVPLNISVNAEDGDILYCGGYKRNTVTDTLGTRSYFYKNVIEGLNDKNLIESNELGVINDLEFFIKNYLNRWHNIDYVEHHNLYLAVVTGIIASQLPGVLINARLKRIHTNETHSFLVREFFESNGRLSKYTDVLPIAQRLWIYRNYRYLSRYVGRQDIFKSVIDNIATPVRVPLSTYTLRHNLTNVPENLLPETVVRREVLNFRQAGTGREAVDIHTLLLREIPLARDNGYDLDNVELAIENRVKNNHNNRLPTKIVDSQMLDTTDTGAFPLARVLYDLWVYGVYRDLYKGVIYITNPSTGDRISLTPKNALILAMFVFHKGYTGEDLVNIPSTVTSMIPREVSTVIHPSFPLLPTVAQLQDSINSNVIDLTFCQSLMGDSYNIPVMNSPDQFYREAVKIHKEINRRYRLCVSQLDAKARAKTEYGMSTLYWLRIPTPISNQTYAQWFNATSISFTGLSQETYVSIGLDIIRQISGNRPNSNQVLKELQEAVIGILKHFSSYTTQFISTISNAQTIKTGRKMIRGTNIREKFSDKIRMRPMRLTMKNIRIKPISTTTIPLNKEYNFSE